MSRKYLAGLALAAVTVWPVTAQDARTVVAAASKAIGIDSLKQLINQGLTVKHLKF